MEQFSHASRHPGNSGPQGESVRQRVSAYIAGMRVVRSSKRSVPALGGRIKRETLLIARLLMSAGPVCCVATASAGNYLGSTDWIIVRMSGCNASAPAQIPGSTDLFLNRQVQGADGQLPGTSPSTCKNIGKHWGLTLDKFDWKTHAFTNLKVVLDTSVDPETNHSRAIILGGKMRGAIIQSAYDPDIVVYHGKYLVAYECTVENAAFYQVNGTSSCLSVYDPSRRVIDLSHTQVIISGMRANGHFYGAAVPELLVLQDRLFVYWSAIQNDNGKIVRIAIRGAELASTSDGFAVKDSNEPVVHSIDPVTTEVWAPEQNDPTANTAVDARALWVSSNAIISMSGLGGEGCVAPSGPQKGCFHLAIARSSRPLGTHIFNEAEKVPEEELPSNPQEYTRPVRGPEGNYWLVGHFAKPRVNGFSELRAVPPEERWDAMSQESVIVIFPITDKSLWPNEPGAPSSLSTN